MLDKKPVSIEIPFEEKISRLFIFRFLWVYVLMFIMIPAMIYVGIVGFIHFWYMLILGRRSEGMWNIVRKFFVWIVSWQSYFQALSDKRPGFWF